MQWTPGSADATTAHGIDMPRRAGVMTADPEDRQAYLKIGDVSIHQVCYQVDEHAGEQALLTVQHRADEGVQGWDDAPQHCPGCCLGGGYCALHTVIRSDDASPQLRRKACLRSASFTGCCAGLSFTAQQPSIADPARLVSELHTCSAVFRHTAEHGGMVRDTHTHSVPMHAGLAASADIDMLCTSVFHHASMLCRARSSQAWVKCTTPGSLRAGFPTGPLAAARPPPGPARLQARPAQSRPAGLTAG